jgi:chromosome segregation ATPase
MKCDKCSENPAEKERQKAIGNITSGTYHHVDLEGWKRLNLATTHRVFRELLNELHTTKEIADCRLDEIDRLISDYKESDNKLCDALEVTDALNDEREKLEGKLDYAQNQITEKSDSINKLRRQVAELQNSEWPTTKAYNELIDKVNYANKLVDDAKGLSDGHIKVIAGLESEIKELQAKLNYANTIIGTQKDTVKALRKDNDFQYDRIGKLDCKLNKKVIECQRKSAEIKKQFERIQELKNLGFAKAYGDPETDWRVRPEVTETDWQMRCKIADQTACILRKDLALVQKERDSKHYLDGISSLKAEVAEQKEHHLRYYKINSKTTNENAELRQHIKDLKEIDQKSDTKIKDLKETIQERDDELKEWHTEKVYFISFDTIDRVTIDGKAVRADKGNFYTKSIPVGTYTRCGKGYVVFCKGSISAPVTTRIR